ncbi:hypothetical protein A1WG_03951 [Escherichia sp. KTE96]|nr:hypothetical protein [Escherichia coli]ELC19791.1 hypothetical protein WCO_01245 [Escherichia sp. KTE11]EOV87725.1 hypothetical protein A1WG_03951 [Escherichia sp. KTE96]PSS42357.1 hypothetical protein BEM40_000035 [Escherichia sp. MOD1-EC5451]
MKESASSPWIFSGCDYSPDDRAGIIFLFVSANLAFCASRKIYSYVLFFAKKSQQLHYLNSVR